MNRLQKVREKWWRWTYSTIQFLQGLKSHLHTATHTHTHTHTHTWCVYESRSARPFRGHLTHLLQLHTRLHTHDDTPTHFDLTHPMRSKGRTHRYSYTPSHQPPPTCTLHTRLHTRYLTHRHTHTRAMFPVLRATGQLFCLSPAAYTPTHLTHHVGRFFFLVQCRPRVIDSIFVFLNIQIITFPMQMTCKWRPI